MQPTTFGLASLLAGTTLSAPAVLTPLSKRGDPIASNTQSCWSKQGGHGIAYHVHVGEPWDAGSGCKDIKAALDNAQVQFNTLGWTCGDDGYGDTSLYIDSYGVFDPVLEATPMNYTAIAGAINTALHNMYPHVNGFNCPDK